MYDYAVFILAYNERLRDSALQSKNTKPLQKYLTA